MAARIERALQMIRNMPRVTIGTIRDDISTKGKKKRGKGKHGRGQKGSGRTGQLPRLGLEGGNRPFYLRIPKEPYYHGRNYRRQYPPLSLLQLQRFIDMGRVDPTHPIDLSTICNTGLFNMNVDLRQYGVNLTDEGADIFQAKVNIEVQWTNEVTIAAIERNGGMITTRFFDPPCVYAMVDPLKFLKKASPIPRCKLPPEELVEYYSSAQNRGYLADIAEIQKARLQLAQKYGYELPDLTNDPLLEMLLMRKDPRQIYYGLEPGWVVLLKYKKILKPADSEYKEYYKS